MFDEVDQDIIPEVLRRGEERPALVELGQTFDETTQPGIGVEFVRERLAPLEADPA